MKKLLLVSCLFSFLTEAKAQLKIDISANGLSTGVHRVFAGALDLYHYELKYENGYEIKSHFTYELGSKNKFLLSGNVGFRNSGFHGRHYVELLRDSSAGFDMKFRKYEWETYKLNHLVFSLGCSYSFENFRFSVSGQSIYLLNSKSNRQEVHLSDFYDGNVFFEKEGFSDVDLFNSLDAGVFVEIDYKLYRKLYLNLNSYFGLTSLTHFEKLDYLYKARTFGVGLKYIDLF